ncbi:MAG TPA: DUF6326 family protein, partial [Actinophytocola sp.]|uniref:DUF6326 family protein n=1 Tax=Actinophytocola sp. TaxID=1872138 RepID=UPI002DBE7121
TDAANRARQQAAHARAGHGADGRPDPTDRGREMTTDTKAPTAIDVTLRMSTLWVVVLFNMLFADILNFVTPGTLREIMTGYAGSLRSTPGILLAFAVLLEVPIAMIFLSRVLSYRVNRWANIIACALTTVFTVAGGTANLHYAFLATVEVVCMSLIAWYAWTWRGPVGFGA